MNITHLSYSARQALVAAVLISALGVASFFAFEPSLGHSASGDSRDFTVTQQITQEVSFLVNPNNVTMSPNIAGITGGYASGTATTSVRTNNATGYSMTLHFATTTSGESMQASSTASINDYSPASAGTPDYLWQDNGAGGAAEFGYTVEALTAGEVDERFMDNGSNACNTGSTEGSNTCWYNPTTTPTYIISSAAPNTSSTTTIKFKVAVPSNPSPSLPSAFYTATGTLTIYANP